MAYLESFTHTEGFSQQTEIPGIASIIHEDPINQATYGNHCELSSTTILAVYKDVTNGKGMVRIGTRVSDFAIEWGTAVAFDNELISYIIPVRVSDTKFLIVYQGYVGYGYTISGTVNGTVPTLGTRVLINTGDALFPIGAVLMDTDKVMIAFANSSTNGQCVIASLAGTTITHGAIATFVATSIMGGFTTRTQLCKHSTTFASVVYRVSNTVTEVVTLTLSGTTITANTAGKAAFGGSTDIAYPSIGALDATKFVIAYTDCTDSNKGNAQVGIISGTTISAGGSEYAFDTNNTATRIPCISVISSTLFAVIYTGTQYCPSVKIGYVDTGSTGIVYGAALSISDDTSAYKYPSINYECYTYITYTKSRQLTFSYLTKGLNQFVCGMLTQNYKTLDIAPMCYKVATAGAGEQVEISSLYLNSNISGFLMGASRIGSLYFNGTLPSNKFYSTDDLMGANNGNGTAYAAYARRLGMSNEPIILTAGQSLYASIDTNQGTSTKKGSCTVFGLLRKI